MEKSADGQETAAPIAIDAFVCVRVCVGGSAPVKGGQSSLLSREGGNPNVK